MDFSEQTIFIILESLTLITSALRELCTFQVNLTFLKHLFSCYKLFGPTLVANSTICMFRFACSNFLTLEYLFHPRENKITTSNYIFFNWLTLHESLSKSLSVFPSTISHLLNDTVIFIFHLFFHDH